MHLQPWGEGGGGGIGHTLMAIGLQVSFLALKQSPDSSSDNLLV